MGYKVPREAWRIIEIKIRRYPDNKKIYETTVDALLHNSSESDGMPRGNSMGNPTERIAIKLAEDRRLERIKKEIDAVESVYKELLPEHQKVIRVRFWSNRHKNMPYLWMEPATGYKEAQMKRVCGLFVKAVGERLGEI